MRPPQLGTTGRGRAGPTIQSPQRWRCPALGPPAEPGDPMCWGSRAARETSVWFYRGRSSSFPPRHPEVLLSTLYRLGCEAWGKCDVLKGTRGEAGKEK